MGNRRMRVYISGPITTGGQDKVPVNLKTGILTWRELIRRGFAPWCPHMNDIGYIVSEPVSWEDALEVDEEWVDVSDVLLRLPGASKGGDREERYARDRGIPVVYSIEELERLRESMNDSIEELCEDDSISLFKVLND